MSSSDSDHAARRGEEPPRPGPQPPAMSLSEEERATLPPLSRAHTTPPHLSGRAQRILWVGAGLTAPAEAACHGTPRPTVRRWRRHGCKRPGESGPVRRPRALADEARQRGLGETISARPRGHFFPSGRAPTVQESLRAQGPPDVLAAEPMAALTTRYAHAPAGVAAGARELATDARPGLQALERQAPTRRLEPGQAARRACAAIRRGPVTWSAHGDGAQGTVVAPSLGPTRTAEDGGHHMARPLTSAPEGRRGPFVADHRTGIRPQAWDAWAPRPRSGPPGAHRHAWPAPVDAHARGLSG
jgi:hypothetical protein